MRVQECPGEEDQHVTTPAACESFMRPDIHRPFSAKHGLQQASIIGNMEDYDLLTVGHAVSPQVKTTGMVILTVVIDSIHLTTCAY
jgi:hypothetical protein